MERRREGALLNCPAGAVHSAIAASRLANTTKHDQTHTHARTQNPTQAFNDSGVARNPGLDLYPPHLRAEVDAVNAWAYPDVNDGVYKCAPRPGLYLPACPAFGFSRLCPLSCVCAPLARRVLLARELRYSCCSASPERKTTCNHKTPNTNNANKTTTPTKRCGFARSQAAYDDAFGRLFAALDRCEEILSRRRYIAGDALTEADVRLYM